MDRGNESLVTKKSSAAVLALVVLVCPASASADLVSELRLVAQRVQAMLTAARRGGDAIRIACLDDKLSRAHAAVTEAQTSRGPRRARSLRERARTIQAEAEACVGAGRPPRGIVRETVVDPNLPSGDTTLLPEGTVWVDRPPSASGYY